MKLALYVPVFFTVVFSSMSHAALKKECDDYEYEMCKSNAQAFIQAEGKRRGVSGKVIVLDVGCYDTWFIDCECQYEGKVGETYVSGRDNYCDYED